MSATVDEKRLKYIDFLNRENNDMHHTDEEDELQYRLMAMGDPAAVKETERLISSALPGRISPDPLRNSKYLFVASAALASRAAIHGGMDTERAYNISDLYILKMDTLTSVEDVRTLHIEMISFYTQEMARLEKRTVISRAVSVCIDYICRHLHERITVETLAAEVSLSPAYLSTLFKNEMHISISDYILRRKTEVAENMLRYSSCSCSEISEILAFSSQSHFIRVFRAHCHMTPLQYRRHMGSGSTAS